MYSDNVAWKVNNTKYNENAYVSVRDVTGAQTDGTIYTRAPEGCENYFLMMA
jgi:hypothetical protein